MVTPEKMYGKRKGEELIQKFSKRPYNPKRYSRIEISENRVLLPAGEIEPSEREFLHKIEESTGMHILKRTSNSVVRHLQNTTLEIPHL